MRQPDLQYRKLVLVCTNEREENLDCCAKRGSLELYKLIKQTLKAADPSIRVSRTGCLGNCLSGVSVVIMPDDIWLGEVTRDDVPKIVELALTKSETHGKQDLRSEAS